MILHEKKNQNKRPGIAVSILVQNATDIVAACTRDRDELEKNGLNWDVVVHLCELARECTEICKRYKFEIDNCKLETIALEEYVKGCMRLRSEIASKMRAVNSTFGLDMVVPVFRKSTRRSELAQDLADLAATCRKNYSELERVGFDLEIGKIASDQSKLLINLIADAALNRDEASLLLKKRNLISHEISESISGIRAIGKKVFKGQTRIKDYVCTKPH